MKRRMILAVLFVVALVVVAVVLIGDTDRHGNEATKGKPLVGSSGATRSVASIAARQRFVDNHPSALPSAADIAAAEGVQPGEGEEGVAAREQSGGEAESEGDEQAQGREEQAQSGEPSRAGAESVGGQRVKEKPEPGEESLPPKVAGPAPPLQRSGRSAIAPRSSLSSGTSFLGADFGDSGFVPPDSMGAVGPTQILVDVNGRLRVFDKSGNQILVTWTSPTRPSGTRSSQPASSRPTRASSTTGSPGAGSSRRSRSRTTTTSSCWRSATAPRSPTRPASPSSPSPSSAHTGQFADYPQLGVDANAIYIGVNRFGSLSGSFTGTSLYVIQKSSVISAGPMHVTGFQTVSSPGASGPDSPQPATNMDPGAGTGYVVGAGQSDPESDGRRQGQQPGHDHAHDLLLVGVPAEHGPAALGPRPGGAGRDRRPRRPVLRGDGRPRPRRLGHSVDRTQHPRQLERRRRRGWRPRRGALVPGGQPHHHPDPDPVGDAVRHRRFQSALLLDAVDCHERPGARLAQHEHGRRRPFPGDRLIGPAGDRPERHNRALPAHPVELEHLQPGLRLSRSAGATLADGRRPNGRPDLLDVPGVRQREQFLGSTGDPAEGPAAGDPGVGDAQQRSCRASHRSR